MEYEVEHECVKADRRITLKRVSICYSSMLYLTHFVKQKNKI